MKRIGVLGFGRRMGFVLDRVVAASDGKIGVDAFYDASKAGVERVKAARPDIRVCGSVAELVNIGNLDWIFIGSFNAAHRDHAVAAINAGKHVFCEKPIAITRQQCLDILEAQRRHPRKDFAVGFVLRYSAFYRQMKEWIDQGRLGDLISMEFNETLAPDQGAAIHGNWRRKSALAGTMLVEKCCHDIDLMLWMTGSRPARVASFGGLNFFKPGNARYNEMYPLGKDGFRYYDRGLATGWAVGSENNITPFNDDKDIMDNQVAIMELENGSRVVFHLCMHSAQQERRFYMCGSKGTIRGDVLTGALEHTPVGWEPKTETVRPIQGDNHGGAEDAMAQNIVACILDGKPMPTTVEDGVRASFTCFGIDEARETGKVVGMDTYWSGLDK